VAVPYVGVMLLPSQTAGEKQIVYFKIYAF